MALDCLHPAEVRLDDALRACDQLLGVFDRVVLPATPHDRLDATSEAIVSLFVQSAFFQQLLHSIFGYGQVDAAYPGAPTSRSWMAQAHFNPLLRARLLELLRPDGALLRIVCHLCQPEADKAGGRFPVSHSRLRHFTSEAIKKGEADHLPDLVRFGFWTVGEDRGDGVQMNLFAYYMLSFAAYITETYRATNNRQGSSQNYDVAQVFRQCAKETAHYWLADFRRWGGLLQAGLRGWGPLSALLSRGQTPAFILQQRQQSALLTKANQAVTPLPEDCYLTLLEQYLEHWYQDYPSQVTRSGYHTLAVEEAQQQYFGSIMMATFTEYWLDRAPLEELVARKPTLSIEEVWRRYAALVRCLCAAEARHLRRQWPAWRRPAGPPYGAPALAKLYTQEQLSATVYQGLLYYLRNTLLLHGKYFPEEHLPVNELVDLWLLYTTSYSSCPEFPWLLFAQHHYEAYSLLLVVFLDFCSRVGFLHDFVVPSAPPASQPYADTGPRVLARLLQAFSCPPLREALQRISADLVKLEDSFIGLDERRMISGLGELGPLGRPGLGPREVIPLFTADRLGQVETLLEAAWANGPLDFLDDMAELTTKVNDFFGVQELIGRPFPVLESIGVARSNAAGLEREGPERESRRSARDPVPPLTAAGVAQILEGRRCPRTSLHVVFVGDPDEKPILPSENAWLVRRLLRLQRVVQPPVEDKLHFKLRLRWMASYPLQGVLVFLFYFFGTWHFMAGLMILGTFMSWFPH